MRDDVDTCLNGTVSQIAIARGGGRVTHRAGDVHDDDRHDKPGEREADNARAEPPAPLKEHDGETNHHDIERDLFFGGERQHAGDQQPNVVSGQHEIGAKTRKAMVSVTA